MASQQDPRLEALFERLVVAESSEAREIEEKIWGIWMTHGDAAVDRDMMAGMVAMEAGDPNTAMHEFDAVIAAAPEFAEGWNRRATLFYMLRSFPESVADIDRTLALEPRHFGALSGLALIRETQGRPFEALEALETVVRIHPQMPHLHERIQQLTSQLGEAI